MVGIKGELQHSGLIRVGTAQSLLADLLLSQADHLSALSGFLQLVSLECPRWPDAYEEWTEPEDLVREVGNSLTRLQLLGLSGQQSEGSWWRLGRDEKGAPIQVDDVTFYSLDLDRPCY